jgi:DNA-binding NtrC family response regulator
VRRKKLRFDALFAETADPVFVLGPKRQIVFFNRACEALTGRAADEVADLVCAFHAPDADDGLASLTASLAAPPEVFAGQTQTRETLVPTGHGARIRRSIHFMPCHDESGCVIYVIGHVGVASASPAETTAATDLHTTLLRLRDRLYQQFGFDRIVGASPVMGRVLEQTKLAAKTDSHFLIWGEAGAGKELIARTVHREGARRANPFVAVDCALTPPDVLERDLFGSTDRGDAGVRRDRVGLVERLCGGTLFVRNSECLPRDLQARLLDVVRTARLDPTDSRESKLPVRLITASRVDPADWAADDSTRPDFYLATSALVIHVPALRERTEDLPLLAQWCVGQCNAADEKQVTGLSAEAIEVLRGYDWPGNVRELGEVIGAAHRRCATAVIEPRDLPERIQGSLGGPLATPPPEPERIELEAKLVDTERSLIEQALRRARGNKAAAAELLGISRPRLYRRMVTLGLDDAAGPRQPT